MSKFYGMVVGNRGAATRGGSRASGFKATAQSYDGSVITRLDYNRDNQLEVTIEMEDGRSAPYGDIMFRGTYDELKEVFRIAKLVKERKATVTVHREKSNKQLALERAFAKVE